MSEAAIEIALGLTTSQRRAVLRLDPDAHHPYSRVYGKNRTSLFGLGVLQYVAADTMELTPLGKQVRAHLLASEGGNPNG